MRLIRSRQRGASSAATTQHHSNFNDDDDDDNFHESHGIFMVDHQFSDSNRKNKPFRLWNSLAQWFQTKTVTHLLQCLLVLNMTLFVGLKVGPLMGTASTSSSSPPDDEDPAAWLDRIPSNESRSMHILDRVNLEPFGNLSARPSCLVPDLDRTLSYLSRPYKPGFPYLNMGLPKSGSSSLTEYFRCHDIRTMQHRCGWNTKAEYCGECIRRIIAEHKARQWYTMPRPTRDCGTGVYEQALTQLDMVFPPQHCYFPQISALDEIHRESPEATFIILFRPIDDWIRSINHWGKESGVTMRDRLVQCDVPGFPAGVGKTDEEMREFVCRHVQHIRDFVKYHPTHELIELDLYSNRTHKLLNDIFHLKEKKGIDKEDACWTQANANDYI